MNSNNTNIDRHALDDLIKNGLSARTRFLHLGLLLIAAGVSIVLLSLLTTEPNLPVRTQASFGVMLLISLAWVAYAVWALKHRWTLHAQHRIAAASIALVASTLFTLAAGLMAVITAQPAAWAASSTGVFMMALAGLAIAAAYRKRRLLMHRRDELLTRLARNPSA